MASLLQPVSSGSTAVRCAVIGMRSAVATGVRPMAQGAHSVTSRLGLHEKDRCRAGNESGFRLCCVAFQVLSLSASGPETKVKAQRSRLETLSGGHEHTGGS